MSDVLHGHDSVLLRMPCGKTCIYDAEDMFLVVPITWCIGTCGYAQSNVRVDGKNNLVTMHRLVMRALPLEVVDHIDGNTLDNRKKNLRFATKSQNSMNGKLRSHNTSGYKGVSFSKRRNKWVAYVSVNKKKKYLGIFSTAKEAASAYNVGSNLYYGHFARPNEIS